MVSLQSYTSCHVHLEFQPIFLSRHIQSFCESSLSKLMLIHLILLTFRFSIHKFRINFICKNVHSSGFFLAKCEVFGQQHKFFGRRQHIPNISPRSSIKSSVIYTAFFENYVTLLIQSLQFNKQKLHVVYMYDFLPWFH